MRNSTYIAIEIHMYTYYRLGKKKRNRATWRTDYVYVKERENEKLHRAIERGRYSHFEFSFT